MLYSTSCTSRTLVVCILATVCIINVQYAYYARLYTLVVWIQLYAICIICIVNLLAHLREKSTTSRTCIRARRIEREDASYEATSLRLVLE